MFLRSDVEHHHRLRPGLTTHPTELHTHSTHAMFIES